jgi:hypothetical protein
MNTEKKSFRDYPYTSKEFRDGLQQQIKDQAAREDVDPEFKAMMEEIREKEAEFFSAQK